MILTSSRPVLSEEEAVAAARLAYPGVERVVVPGPPAPPPAGPVRAALRRWGRAMAAGSLLIAALVDRRRDQRRREQERADREPGGRQTPG